MPAPWLLPFFNSFFMPTLKPLPYCQWTVWLPLFLSSSPLHSTSTEQARSWARPEDTGRESKTKDGTALREFSFSIVISGVPLLGCHQFQPCLLLPSPHLTWPLTHASRELPFTFCVEVPDMISFRKKSSAFKKIVLKASGLFYAHWIWGIYTYIILYIIFCKFNKIIYNIS